MNYAFIILHYNEKTLPDTSDCIESIFKIAEGQDYQIVIVENGSQDTSLARLQKDYRHAERVKVLSSADNLGFARGNNLGCDYAIQKWQPDFLIVINNDTYIDQPDFLQKISSLYREFPFHILGPNIRDKNNHPQNPVGSFPITLDEIDQGIRGLGKRLAILNRCCFQYWLQFKGKKHIKKTIKTALLKTPLAPLLRETSSRDGQSLSMQKGVALHGAALIFSKKYYRAYDSVFYPGTFMFKEEDILYYRVKHHHLQSLYHPAVCIHHKEDRSTNSRFTGCQKEKFIVQNQLQSFRVYREYIVEDQGQHPSKQTDRP